MAQFTDEQIEYLNSQFLGRLATATAAGRPHVVPVGFRYNPEHGTIDIGGHDFAGRKKFRDVQQNSNVAFVVDDIVSMDPYWPRMLEVRGKAEILPTGGKDIYPHFDDVIFRITPSRIVSFSLTKNELATENG